MPTAPSARPPLALRLLNRVVRVEAAEVSAMLWSFAYFLCLLCAYYVLRPVRDEMGIQGGVGNLQWLFTGTFIAMLAAVPMFGWLSSRFPRRLFLPAVYLFFVANLLVFFVLLDSGVARRLVAPAFFIWLSVFNLFVVSVFWSFMSDLYRNEQARRLFGFIAAGGSTGALIGPSLTALIAPVAGPALLLPVSACFLLGAVLCIVRLNAWSTTDSGVRRRNQHAGKALGGGILDGITLLLRSEYLMGIGLYVVLFTLLSTFLYFQQAYIVSEHIADPGQRTALFAMIDLGVNALTLIGQLLVVSRLIQRFGLALVLVLLPAVAVVGFFLLGLFPTLVVLVAFGVIRRAGEYAISKPAREILFTVLSPEEKYKAKNVIDTVVYRGGDAVSGWLFEGLRMLGMGFSGIAFAAVPIAALWGVTGYLLGRRQEQLQAALTAKRRVPDHGSITTQIPGQDDAGGTGAGSPQPQPR
jgi:ATP:ADP antiporter, AAA family